MSQDIISEDDLMIESEALVELLQSSAPLEEIKECFEETYGDFSFHGSDNSPKAMLLLQCIRDQEGITWTEPLLTWLYTTFAQKGVELKTLIDATVPTDFVSVEEVICVLEALYQYARENAIVFPITENITRYKHISLLDWWKDKLPVDYQVVFVVDNKPFGDADVIEWWTKTGFPIVFTEEFVRESDFWVEIKVVRMLHEAGVQVPDKMIANALFLVASEEADLSKESYEIVKQELDWLFKEYGEYIKKFVLEKDGEFMYESACVADDSGPEYHLIRYLHANSIPFYYTSHLIDNMSNMAQAKFWHESGLTIKYTNGGLLGCLQSDVRFGEWWLKNDLKLGEWWFENELAYENTYCVDSLIKKSRWESMKFLMDKGINMTYTQEGLDNNMYSYNHNEQPLLEMMEWMVEQGWELKYTDRFLTKCLQGEMYSVLELCHKHGYFPLEKDFGTHTYVTKNMHQILSWWLNKGLKLVMSKDFVKYVSKKPDLVNLLEKHGYVLEKFTKEKKPLKNPKYDPVACFG